MFNFKTLFTMSTETKDKTSPKNVSEWLKQQNIDVVCHHTSGELSYAEKFIAETGSKEKPEDVLKELLKVRKEMISQPAVKK